MIDIVERIASRIHDAPMPTEHLLDEAADYIERLQAALEWMENLDPPLVDAAREKFGLVSLTFTDGKTP